MHRVPTAVHVEYYARIVEPTAVLPRLITAGGQIAGGVEAQRLRLGYLNDTEWQRLSDAFGALSDVPLFFDDSAALTITEVRSRARRLQAEVGCDLLIVDYLQLMSSRRSDNRVQE